MKQSKYILLLAGLVGMMFNAAAMQQSLPAEALNTPGGSVGWEVKNNHAATQQAPVHCEIDYMKAKKCIDARCYDLAEGLLKSIESCSACGDVNLKAQALDKLGLICLMRSNNCDLGLGEKARSYFQKALDFQDISMQTRLVLWFDLAGLYCTHEFYKSYDKALAYYQKVAQHAEVDAHKKMALGRIKAVEAEKIELMKQFAFRLNFPQDAADTSWLDTVQKQCIAERAAKAAAEQEAGKKRKEPASEQEDSQGPAKPLCLGLKQEVN